MQFALCSLRCRQAGRWTRLFVAHLCKDRFVVQIVFLVCSCRSCRLSSWSLTSPVVGSRTLRPRVAGTDSQAFCNPCAASTDGHGQTFSSSHLSVPLLPPSHTHSPTHPPTHPPTSLSWRSGYPHGRDSPVAVHLAVDVPVIFFSFPVVAQRHFPWSRLFCGPLRFLSHSSTRWSMPPLFRSCRLSEFQCSHGCTR